MQHIAAMYYYIVLYTFLIAILIANIFLNLGVIHYERSLPSPRRTLINLLLSYQSMLNFIMVSLVHGAIALILAFGSFGNGIFCNALPVLVLALSLSVFIIANAIMILRHVQPQYCPSAQW